MSDIGMKLRRAILLAIGMIVAALFATILYDSQISNGFTSFTGKSEVVTLTLSPTAQQYGWALSGAYVCSESRFPGADTGLGLHVDGARRALCGGPHGEPGREFTALPTSATLAVTEDTTLEVAIIPAPLGVEAQDFALGRVPTHILVISKADPLDSAQCATGGRGTPMLTTANARISLWDDAEVHIPITERTLMPFSGRIMVGQTVSADTPNQLRSGTVAVYRNLSHLPYLNFLNFGSGGPQLVSETPLFAGDVVTSMDHRAKCFSKASGFMKAQEDGDGAFIEVVASTHASEGKIFVNRDTPDETGAPAQIGIEMQFGDAVVNHPFTVWLGLVVSTLLIAKEASDYWRSGGSSAAKRVASEQTKFPSVSLQATGLPYKLASIPVGARATLSKPEITEVLEEAQGGERASPSAQ